MGHKSDVRFRDLRTKDWPLVSSTCQLLLIISVYLFLVLYWIPRFMKNKPPYKLTTFIKCYNIFQIVANIWLVREHIAAGWLTTIPFFTCIPVTYSYELSHYKLSQILWWVLMLKIVDFTETIIFALRKKDKQISTQHVYHHVSTVVLIWIGVRYVSGEMTTFITFLNCTVHVYTFYFLTAFGPHTQAIISPIKPYVTLIQMVQLSVILIYCLRALTPSCNIGAQRIFPILALVNVIINLYMFYTIYRKTYTSKVKQ